MLKQMIRFLSLMMASLVLVACSSTPDDPNGGNGGSSGGQGYGYGSGSGASGGDFDGPIDPQLVDVRVIYFDFDKSDIRADAIEVLRSHAANLSSDSSIEIILEGHTDQRGTREYNLALGERRAKSVRDFLVNQGVSSSNIEIVSYGKENLANEGESESAYAENRRVVIRYK